MVCEVIKCSSCVSCGADHRGGPSPHVHTHPPLRMTGALLNGKRYLINFVNYPP